MIKAIIFDFDGVIVYSDIPRFKALQNYAKKYNIEIQENSLKTMIGLTTRDFLTKILTGENSKSINNILDDYENNYKTNILKFVSSIDSTVNFIKNYNGNARLAIASGSSVDIINKILMSFGIFEKFEVIVGKEDVEKNKPDPETYLKALADLKIKSSDCIAIEDSVIGAKSAVDANIKCFVFLNEMNNKVEFSNIPIEDFISSYEDFNKLI